MPLMVLMLCVGVASTLPVLVTALVARALGVGVPQIAAGVGRPRLEWTLGGTAVLVTPWLFASSCTFKDHDDPDLGADAPGRPFGKVHPVLRALVVLSGPLVVLALCVAAAGTAAGAAFVQSFGQIIDGALDPLGQAQAYLGRYGQAADAAPFATGALLLAKLVAFSLLPLPLLAGGNSLLQLVRWKRPGLPPWVGPVLQVSLLLILAMVVSWTVALAVFLLG